MFTWFQCYKNESYLACIQLAVLDHNEHIVRENAVNQNEDIIYHRKDQKTDEEMGFHSNQV